MKCEAIVRIVLPTDFPPRVQLESGLRGKLVEDRVWGRTLAVSRPVLAEPHRLHPLGEEVLQERLT